MFKKFREQPWETWEFQGLPINSASFYHSTSV